MRDWYWFCIGILTPTLGILQTVSAKDHVQVAFLERLEDGSGVLKMYHTENETGVILLSNVSVVQKVMLTMCSHAPSGIICWLAQLVEGQRSEIHCYHENGSYSTLFLPLELKIDRDASSSSYYFHLEMDLHGNNIYWRDRETGSIWATSLKSRTSELILTHTKSGHPTQFHMDTLEGYVLEIWKRPGLFDDVLLRVKVSKRSVKYPANELMPFSTNWNVEGIAVDLERKTLYYISWEKLYRSKYENCVFTDPSEFCPAESTGWTFASIPAQAEDPYLYLHYYDSHLYMLMPDKLLDYTGFEVAGSGDSMPDPVNSYSVNNATARAMSIYQDTRPPGQENPCDRLNCSHLCVSFYSIGYTCLCPSGMTLVNESLCTPSLVMLYSVSQLLDMSNANQELSNATTIYSLNSPVGDFKSLSGIFEDGTATFAELEPDTRNKMRTLFRLVIEHDPPIAFDPFGIGCITVSSKRCIRLYSSALDEFSVLHCTPSAGGDITAVAIDFTNWIAFWTSPWPHAYKPKYAQTSAVITGKSILLDQELSRFVFHTPVTSLTVDGGKKRLYWYTLGHSSISSADYDGTNLYVVPISPDFFVGAGSLKSIEFSDNCLLLYSAGQKDVPGSLISRVQLNMTVYDLAAEQSKHFFSTQSDYYMLHNIMPPVKPKSPCSTANCSHFCLPSSSSDYKCACPEPLILVRDVCRNPILLVVYHNANPGDNQQTSSTKTYLDIIQIYEKRSPSSDYPDLIRSPWNTLDVDPKDLILTTRTINQSQEICYYLRGDAIFHCVALSTNTTESMEIHPKSSILLFDSTGMEYFYNNGQAGNIFLKSLSTQTLLALPAFEANNVTIWALDTENKVFFWCEGQEEVQHIHFKVLLGTKLEEGVFQAAQAVSVTGLAINTLTKVLYIVQNQFQNQGGSSTHQAIKQIAYKDLFRESSEKELGSHYDKIVGLAPISFPHTFLFFISANYFDPFDNMLAGFNLRNFETTSLVRLPQGFQVTHLLDLAFERNGKPGGSCASFGCSHFCFPLSPLLEETETTKENAKCVCPKGWTLDTENERVCNPIVVDRSLLITLVSVSAASAIILISGLIAGIIWKRKRDNRLADLIEIIKNGDPRAVVSGHSDAENAQHLPLNCVIPPSKLSVNKEKILGEGAYGMVLQGVLNMSAVAVKTLKPSLNLDNLAEFAKEVKIMNYIGYHPNIVRFHGAEISNIGMGTFYAVIELSPVGSLIEYLRKTSLKSRNPSSTPILYDHFSGNEPSIPKAVEVEVDPTHEDESQEDTISYLELSKLVRWSEDIARGMEYLSSKSVIHGDLAARNVLIFEKDVLKITDFGLARNVGKDDLYKKKSRVPLPWRWMALESLQYMYFSTKSDVWSYGVTLWEMFTFGRTPYPQDEWDQKFTELLENGLVLDRPKALPEFLYDHLLKPCWILDPEKRLSFTQILQRLQEYNKTWGDDQ